MPTPEPTRLCLMMTVSPPLRIKKPPPLISKTCELCTHSSLREACPVNGTADVRFGRQVRGPPREVVDSGLLAWGQAHTVHTQRAELEEALTPAHLASRRRGVQFLHALTERTALPQGRLHFVLQGGLGPRSAVADSVSRMANRLAAVHVYSIPFSLASKARGVRPRECDLWCALVLNLPRGVLWIAEVMGLAGFFGAVLALPYLPPVILPVSVIFVVGCSLQWVGCFLALI